MWKTPIALMCISFHLQRIRYAISLLLICLLLQTLCKMDGSTNQNFLNPTYTQKQWAIIFKTRNKGLELVMFVALLMATPFLRNVLDFLGWGLNSHYKSVFTSSGCSITVCLINQSTIEKKFNSMLQKLSSLNPLHPISSSAPIRIHQKWQS